MVQSDEGRAARRSQLFRVSISCPKCGSRPAMRITETMKRALKHEEPSDRLVTYQCQRRTCGYVYDIPAAAYQDPE
jgi:rubredoxin